MASSDSLIDKPQRGLPKRCYGSALRFRGLLRAGSFREVVGDAKPEARGSFFYCFYLFTEDTQVTGQVSLYFANNSAWLLK